MQDVRVDRNKYIGGSDIPIILGISPFRTRYELLLEKADVKKNDFEGNEYTEFGNILEPQIRDFYNALRGKNYQEGKYINGYVRCHTDGEDDESIIEIKTTSQIHESVADYKVYLAQVIYYLYNEQKETAHLLVYERPSDMNTEFDANRLHMYENIKLSEYKDLESLIRREVDRFMEDLEKVKANPFITEEELQPKEIVEISNKLALLENKLAQYKQDQLDYDNLKKALYEAMNKYGTKKWTTTNGTQITRVDGTADTEVESTEFDEKTFSKEHKDLYDEYSKVVTKIKKGRSGYVKITLPQVE